MPLSSVSLSKAKALRSKMMQCKIYEKDIEERFIHSSGHGGQNVNKVATCVHLLHVPTGIQVKCHKERSQGLNRFWARSLLADKIEKQQEKEKREKIYIEQREKRSKRKRSKKSKEAMLAGKRLKSQKKENRKNIPIQKLDDYM